MWAFMFFFFVRILLCIFFQIPMVINSPGPSLANIRPSLNADFHLMRDEGRFGQG